MGMFGQGNAFNLSFRPQPFGNPGSMRRIPMPMGGNFSRVTNVSIQNGPTGFWGFMSGLFGGLSGNIGMPMGGFFGNFGMPMFSGMFGNGCFMPMGGFNTGIGSGVYGMLNGAQMGGPQQTQNQELSNLQQIYPKNKVARDAHDSNKYLIIGKDGGVEKSGTYEELAQSATKAEGTPAESKKDDPSLKATQEDYIKNHPDMKLTRQSDGTALDDKNEVYEWKDDKYVKKETSSNPSTPDAGGASGSGAPAKPAFRAAQ